MSAPASPLRMLAIAVVGLLAIGALVVKQRSPDADGTGLAPAGAQRADPGATGVSASEGASTMDPAPVPVAATPRIVEFGSDRCVPCRLMQPVLASLRSRYADALVVEFVDVVKDRDAGVRNEIMMIPTQVFYGADGRELERHTGFIPEKAIVEIFGNHGIELDLPAAEER